MYTLLYFLLELRIQPICGTTMEVFHRRKMNYSSTGGIWTGDHVQRSPRCYCTALSNIYIYWKGRVSPWPSKWINLPCCFGFKMTGVSACQASSYYRTCDVWTVMFRCCVCFRFMFSECLVRHYKKKKKIHTQTIHLSMKCWLLN